MKQPKSRSLVSTPSNVGHLGKGGKAPMNACHAERVGIHKAQHATQHAPHFGRKG